MVNLHFLGLLEALMECHSTILVKLLPLWTPVLFAFHAQLPGRVKIYINGCIFKIHPLRYTVKYTSMGVFSKIGKF